MDKNLILEFDSGKFELLPRDVAIDLNFINTAIFVKNKKYALRHDLKLPGKDITVSGGKVRVTKNNFDLLKPYGVKGSGKEPKVGDLVQLCVPSGMDQIIFFIIVKLMYEIKAKNNLPVLPQSIVITYADIMKIGENIGKKMNSGALRLSLYKLSTAVVHYSQETLITTNASTISRVTNEGQFNFISFQEIKVETFKKRSKSDLLTDDHEDYASINSDDFGQYNNADFLNFVDRLHHKTDYILKIRLNDFTYQNLLNNVSLWYSLNYILSVDFIEQAVLLYVTANIGKSIDSNGVISDYFNNSVCKSHVNPFVDAIPLAKDYKSIGDSLSRICEALCVLKAKNFIKSYECSIKKSKSEAVFIVDFFPEQANRNKSSLTYGFDLIKADNDVICTTLEDAKNIFDNSSILLDRAEKLIEHTKTNTVSSNSPTDSVNGFSIDTSNLIIEEAIILDEVLIDLYREIASNFGDLAQNVKFTIEDMYNQAKLSFTNVDFDGEVYQVKYSNGELLIRCILSFLNSSSKQKITSLSGLVAWYLKNKSVEDIEREIVIEKQLLIKSKEEAKLKLMKKSEEDLRLIELETKNNQIIINFNSFISGNENIKFTSPDLYERTMKYIQTHKMVLGKLKPEDLAIIICVNKTLNYNLDSIWEYFKIALNPAESFKIRNYITTGRYI